MKNVVHYRPMPADFIAVGKNAFVRPLDHPSELVSNTKEVVTSEVVFYDPESQVFETQNTIYIPVDPS